MNNQSKKIGIIGAMPCEVEPLIAQMENAQTLTVGSITFTQGFLCGKQTVIAICGIGKVFAAMCAQTILDDKDSYRSHRSRCAYTYKKSFDNILYHYISVLKVR